MTPILVWEETCHADTDDVSASLRAEGRAMLDAVSADAAALRASDKRRAGGVSPLMLSEYSERFVLGEHQGADAPRSPGSPGFAIIIAPEFDGILEARCRQALSAGYRLLGPPPDAVALCADKLLLAHRLHAAGVPTPWPTVLAGNALAGTVVHKHRFGAGSVGVGLGPPPGDGLPYIVQPFVAGTPASVAVLTGPAGAVPLLPCAQYLDGFRYVGGSTPLPEPLAGRAVAVALRAVAVVPGLVGYVGVDVILANDPSDDVVVEINPRLTTSYVGLRRLAAENLVGAIVRVAAGDVSPVPWRAGRVAWTADGRVTQ